MQRHKKKDNISNVINLLQSPDYMIYSIISTKPNEIGEVVKVSIDWHFFGTKLMWKSTFYYYLYGRWNFIFALYWHYYLLCFPLSFMYKLG